MLTSNISHQIRGKVLISIEKKFSVNLVDNDEVLQSVTFRLENESYGVNVMQVQEVLRDT